MVSIMTQIIKNLSPLRIGAPEWCPVQQGQECVNARSEEEYSGEEWQVQRKHSQRNKKATANAGTKCYNTHEALSEDDEESAFEGDDD